MTGRVPKGQYRLYREIALAIAASRPILQKAAEENARLAKVGRVYGYPIDYRLLSGRANMTSPEPKRPFRIGFISRVHREKGIAQLTQALTKLTEHNDLPEWTFTLCGPVDVARGGSGEAFLQECLSPLRAAVSPEQIDILPPKFDPNELAAVYQSLDVFVLPSLSEKGETFGVAAVEAMAAGCTVVTSSLSCFSDYLNHGINGLRYDHRAANAPELLAGELARLLKDKSLRKQLSAAGRKTAWEYDYTKFASRLLEDFERIVAD